MEGELVVGKKGCGRAVLVRKTFPDFYRDAPNAGFSFYYNKQGWVKKHKKFPEVSELSRSGRH
ncbi:MAG: hypothetical protein K8R79_04880 [Calditrichales bacterium]|nr:hypothetical protein [Calditrichales bacterium]